MIITHKAAPFLMLNPRDKNMNTEEYLEINDGHIHEALDRIHVSMEYLECALKGHPLLASVSEFDNEINKAVEILADLYQRVGSFDDAKSISNKLGLSKGYKVKQ